ncbi:hypothetical protein Tco_0131018 [Tanacetum coccineum]
MSHIRSDMNTLHRRVRQIEKDDIRAENNRLRMMLDCSEDCIRATQAPYVPPTIPVVLVAHDDPRDPYVAALNAATVHATDDDDPAAREKTSPSEPHGFPPRDS